MVNLIKPDSSGENSSTAEFYTVEESGDSGMSQSGLAILCGVSRQAIIGLENTLVSRSPSKWLEPLVGKGLILVTSESNTVTVNGQPVGNFKIYKADACAAIIQHYAFQGNEVAQYSMSQFLTLGVNVWIQRVTGWQQASPQNYVPYWYQRLTLFTAKTRVPDGWWSVFEELAKLMREMEGFGYVLPDISPTTGRKITPDISIGQMFCRHMRAEGHDVDGTVQKYPHYYPDGRIENANIYPDEWIGHFRIWFNAVWKRNRLIDYLGKRDPESLPSIGKLLGLPEANDE